jgi:hypothetical protein
VDHAIVTAIRRRHTGFLEALGIGGTLIAQRITLGRNHQRWRQATDIPGHQGSSVRIMSVSSILKIMIPVPLHAGAGEHIAFRKALIGIGRIVAVRHRIYEQLEGQGRPTTVTRHQGHGRSQIPTSAVPAYRNTLRVTIDLRGMLDGPLGRRIAIIGGTRKFGLWSQTVVHRYNHTAGAHRQVPSRCIGTVQVTDYPATAVKPHQDREGAGSGGSVDAHRNSRARGGDIALFDLGNLWPSSPGACLGIEAGLLW